MGVRVTSIDLQGTLAHEDHFVSQPGESLPEGAPQVVDRLLREDGLYGVVAVGHQDRREYLDDGQAHWLVGQRPGQIRLHIAQFVELLLQGML